MEEKKCCKMESNKFYEEEWYPPISEALKNLTAEQACWQPEGAASNTIWENVNHLLIFKERLLSRIHEDDTFVAPQNNDDTFSQGGPNDDDAWQQTVKRTLQVHDALQSSLTSFQEAELDQPKPSLPIWQQYMNILCTMLIIRMNLLFNLQQKQLKIATCFVITSMAQIKIHES